MSDKKPFHYMLKFPKSCMDFISSVMFMIMTDADSMKSNLQNVEAMSDLTKHLLRAWWELEQKHEIIRSSCQTTRDENG